MTHVRIIGAGLAGLLAANMLSKRFSYIVYERQLALPNNHSALLRFRSDAVSRETGIPFRRVQVLKGMCASKTNGYIPCALLYAQKVSPEGKLELRSAFKLEPVERFIAPPDFIDRAASGLNIQYGMSVFDSGVKGNPSISTMPMEALMDLLKYDGPRPHFVTRRGGTLSFTIAADLYITVYCPDPDDIFYRISITGDQVIAESLDNRLFTECPSPNCIMKEYFGIDIKAWGSSMRPQEYAKINYLDDEDRRKAERFQLWASVNHNIFSLGRFATWRAGLLLDDLVHDVNKIAGWIENGSFSVMRSM